MCGDSVVMQLSRPGDWEAVASVMFVILCHCFIHLLSFPRRTRRRGGAAAGGGGGASKMARKGEKPAIVESAEGLYAKRSEAQGQGKSSAVLQLPFECFSPPSLILAQ